MSRAMSPQSTKTHKRRSTAHTHKMAAIQAQPAAPAPSVAWFSGFTMFSAQASSSGAKGGAESVGLLEDWNSYVGQQRDVEAGPGGTTTTTSTAAGGSISSAAAAAGSFLANSFTSASNSVAALPGQLQNSDFSIPSTQQLTHFFAFLAGGGVLLLLAFMVFLPVIVLAPAKFALAFTLGCLLIFIGFAQLRGWKQQLASMMTKERLPFSAAYGGSVLATLYVALIMQSYLLSLLCSGLQVVALLYYLLSFFPGGVQGLKFVLNLFWQSLLSFFKGLVK